MDRNSFYINGFLSMDSDGLELILKEFDSNSGKTLKYKLTENGLELSSNHRTISKIILEIISALKISSAIYPY